MAKKPKQRAMSEEAKQRLIRQHIQTVDRWIKDLEDELRGFRTISKVLRRMLLKSVRR